MRRFLSVCSGIEAASVAFQPLGWEAVAFAEIEPFPCQVLAHHYPQVPNLGDLTRFRDWPAHLLEQADILCGGTPCQAFSVAGLRGSLDDERGNLTLTFVHLYDHIDHIRKLTGRPPAVCIWENVPGIFSDKQNAFGCFLAGLVGEAVPLQPAGGKWTHAGAVCGPQRTAAWRVLDAQYHGLAQRRQRVVVVASADPAFDPAAVLFEWDGLRRDTPPSREPGQSTAPTLSARAKGGGGLGTDAECDGAVIAESLATRHTFPCQEVAPTLDASFGKKWGLEDQHINGGAGLFAITHSLRGEGFDASEDGTGRGTPIIPEILAFDTTQITSAANRSQPQFGDPCHPLAAGAHAPAIAFAIQERACCENPMAGPDGVGVRADDCAYTLEARQVPQAIAFQPRIAHNGRGDTGDIINALNAQSGQTGKGDSAPCVAVQESTANYRQQPSTMANAPQALWAVRRLTCEECEILQGFPIGYTLIPGKGKRKGADLQQTTDYLIALGFSAADAAVLAHCPDGPRYKALGNSWAVPVFTWVGTRVERMLNHQPLSE